MVLIHIYIGVSFCWSPGPQSSNLCIGRVMRSEGATRGATMVCVKGQNFQSFHLTNLALFSKVSQETMVAQFHDNIECTNATTMLF